MTDYHMQSGSGGRPGAQRAVVIGAGVSGCACGATLAACGVGVTLVNAALDMVGQPAFGPELLGGPRGWSAIAEVLELLPAALRDVWVEAAMAPEGAPFVSVDRRMLSVQAKRALEGMRGLEFRQGLASDLRIVGCGELGAGQGKRMAAVETAFGEVFEAGAVVVAVGLSLGGRVTVGENELVGGRYGEACSDGLRVALERLGARFAEKSVDVGPRFMGMATAIYGQGAGSGELERVAPAAAQEIVLSVPLKRLREIGGSAVVRGGACGGSTAGVGREPVRWAEDYPESPYGAQELWAKGALAARSSDGNLRPLVSPDGLATGEVAVAPGWEAHARDGASAREQLERGLVASRQGYSVRGLCVCDLDRNGRVGAEDGESLPVWVIGRAGGADGYLESLLSGARSGAEIARVLGVGG